MARTRSTARSNRTPLAKHFADGAIYDQIIEKR
jgi:hypothetical protein